MPDNSTIIGVGSPIVDDIAQVAEAFLSRVDGGKGGMELVEAEVLADLIGQLETPPAEAPGGSAGNTLFALARMGASATFLGKTGNCVGGEYYRKRFAELGGDSSRFKIGDLPNGRCLSLVTPDAERTMRTHLGAAMTLDPGEISPRDFDGCRHAHIEGYLLFNRDLIAKVLSSAREAGCTISLDLASFEVVEAARDILPDLLSDTVDMVFANEEEAGALTGIRDDYPAMARELARYCEIAAVKAGAAGSWIATGEDLFHAPAERVEEVVDTTGAGDLWAAGFLYGWINGMPLQRCAELGSLLGARVVRQQGSELPDAVWDEVMKRVRDGSSAGR